jgi:3-phosphoshikimate 1-carboxyvinyltransferase
MNAITIQTCEPIRGTMRPPGSKSITNRALVCAALADGRTHLSGVLDSNDTRVMVDCLERLGVRAEWSSDRSDIQVHGCGGELAGGDIELFVQNSGTTIRFLTAVVSTGHGRYRLDGNERMRRRPIADLVAALRQLGVRIQCQHDDGCPPVLVAAAGLPGGKITVAGDISSQYLSGILLAAPRAQGAITIRLAGDVVSLPYVTMTMRVMEAFGIEVSRNTEREFWMEPQPYQATNYDVEPDASAAGYFWGAAAISGGEITVQGLTSSSLQGDIGLLDGLVQMGCTVGKTDEGWFRLRGGDLHGIDLDMRQISDTVPTLAVVALFAQGPTTIRGVEHIRHKESNRIGDLARELRKLGAIVHERQDGLQIVPGKLHGNTLQTYDDHRMAMSLSLAGLRIPGVTILDPGCTSKTYPDFFADLARVCKPKA